MFSKPSFFIFILALLCVIVPSNAGQARIHRSKARLSRRQGSDIPQTFTTVTTTTTDAGVVTQTCQVTMTPFVNEEGVNLVRETKSCSIVVTPPAAPSVTTTAAESATETASATESASATETGSATTTTESATATESLVATESATETVSATETASATESAATTESVALTESASFTESASPTETATQATETAITTTESTVAATESAAATTESASAIPETTTASAPAVTESSSAPSESIATPSPSPSVAPTGTGDNGAIPIGTSMVNRESLVTTNPVVTATTPAGAGASPSAPAEASASVSGSAAAAEGTQDSFELPGKKLEVLPIGLGVFAGISVIALIVVGLVTYERTKYRKAFRQRTMAQSGAPMAYGGMAERA